MKEHFSPGCVWATYNIGKKYQLTIFYSDVKEYILSNRTRMNENLVLDEDEIKELKKLLEKIL